MSPSPLLAKSALIGFGEAFELMYWLFDHHPLVASLLTLLLIWAAYRYFCWWRDNN